MRTQQQCEERLKMLMERYPNINHEKHLEDYRICQSFLAGDKVMFESMFEAAYKKMCAYVRWEKSKYLNDQDKEDIIAEAASVSVIKIHMFNGWSLYSTWMKAIARYRIITCINRKNRNGISITQYNESIHDMPLTNCPILDWDSNQVVRELLAQLSDEDSLIVQCKALHKMTLWEIRKRTGFSTKKIQYRYNKSLKQLRMYLNSALKAG